MDGGGGATSNRLSGMLKVEQKCNVSRMYLECASNVSRTKLCEIGHLGVNWTPVFKFPEGKFSGFPFFNERLYVGLNDCNDPKVMINGL